MTFAAWQVALFVISLVMLVALCIYLEWERRQ